VTEDYSSGGWLDTTLMLPLLGWVALVVTAAVVAALYYRGFRRRRMNRERELAMRVRSALDAQLSQDTASGFRGTAA